MITATIRRNLGTSAQSRNGVLSSVTDDQRSTVEVQKLKYYWRWEDEPDMEPQFFAEGVAGQPVSAPFDTQGRAVRFFQIGFTEKGDPNATHPRDGETFLYTPPTAPVLTDATFSAGTTTLSIAAAGGTGDIHVMAQFGTDDYVEVDTVAYDATSSTHSPAVDGDYNYKLIQDGQTGESNIKTVTASGIASPSGTAPTGLDGSWDEGTQTTSLTWTNHGGTGPNSIERKTNAGGWEPIDTVSSSTAAYDDINALQSQHGKTLYYRVRNLSTTGYSNELQVFVEGIF